MIGQTLWTNSSPTRTGRWRRRWRWSCSCLLVVPIVVFETAQRRRARRRAVSACARPVDLQHRLARARTGLPLSADRCPGRLFLQRLAAGHGVGRLVDCTGIASCCDDRADARGGAASSLRIALPSATSRPCSARSPRSRLARLGRFRGRPLFAGMIYAPLVMPEVITGLSLLLLFVAVDRLDRGVLDRRSIAHTTWRCASSR